MMYLPENCRKFNFISFDSGIIELPIVGRRFFGDTIKGQIEEILFSEQISRFFFFQERRWKKDKVAFTYRRGVLWFGRRRERSVCRLCRIRWIQR